MLTKAQGYRDDIWIGRYVAHPLTAWTHLLAGAGMLALLHKSPAPDIGWYWLLFLAVPGVWLFMTSMLFLMAIMIRWMQPDKESPVLASTQLSWPKMLFRREALSAIITLAMVPATLNWHFDRPFDREDFRQCVSTLDLAGQVKLVATVTPETSRHAFRRACYDARPTREAGPLPTDLSELQQKVRAVPSSAAQ